MLLSSPEWFPLCEAEMPNSAHGQSVGKAEPLAPLASAPGGWSSQQCIRGVAVPLSCPFQQGKNWSLLDWGAGSVQELWFTCSVSPAWKTWLRATVGQRGSETEDVAAQTQEINSGKPRCRCGLLWAGLFWFSLSSQAHLMDYISVSKTSSDEAITSYLLWHFQIWRDFSLILDVWPGTVYITYPFCDWGPRGDQCCICISKQHKLFHPANLLLSHPADVFQAFGQWKQRGTPFSLVLSRKDPTNS